MAERFRFSVVYDAATMKAASREYWWRYMTVEHSWPSVLLAFALVDALGLAVFARQLDFVTGLFAGYGLILLLILALLRYGLLRGWRRRAASVGGKSVEYVLTDDNIEYSWALSSSRVSYAYFERIVKLKQTWLLMNGARTFVVLVLAQVPADALKFLEDKIKPRASAGA